MTFDPAAFAEDTGLERLALSLLGGHRIDFDRAAAIYHLGDCPHGGGISVSVGTSDSLGGAAREDLRRSLRPLSFGAAYKALDMLIEHVLRSNGITGARLSFATKRTLLAERPAFLPAPFDRRPCVWDRLAKLFLEFEEARHAITHRRAPATTDGGLRIFDDGRNVIDEITSSELAAFTGAVHAAAELVIAGSDDSRRAALLGWYVNELNGRHGLGQLADAIDPGVGGTRLAKIDLLPVPDNEWRLDLERVRDVIDGQPQPSCGT